MFWIRCFQIRLRSWWDFRDEFLRIPWDPLYQEDPLWWSWAIQQRVGVDLSLPVPDLSFYSCESDVGWGVIVEEYLVSGVWYQSHKGTLHQPQGDDGSPGWPLRVQLSSQRQDDRSLLRLCHRRSGGTRSQDLFLEVREILLWVESMKITLLPQLILGSLNSRADLPSRPNLVMGSVWTLHQEVVQDLLRQWPAIIVLFATSLSARLPVFFASAWHSSSLGTTSGHMPSRPLPSYVSSSQTESLSHLRSHPDRPLLASRDWSPALLDRPSDIPMELP